MEWLVDNWFLLVATIACVACAIITVYLNFISKPKDEQIAKVREWLLYAVIMAEKQFGGGTGQVKLRYVYDMFLSKFPWLAQIISFVSFSGLVDEALDEMKDILAKGNIKVAALIDEK